MEVRKNILERAFELAQSGRCLNVSEIAKQLKAEKYNTDQLAGRALKKQLTQIIDSKKQRAIRK